MARTFTRTQPAQDDDFLSGFNDHDSVVDQVYLFQVKTKSSLLDDALYDHVMLGSSAENIAYTLETFGSVSTRYDDEVVDKKGRELAARFRKEYMHES